MPKKKSSRTVANPLMSIEYSERLSDWKLWENKADELILAARLLEPHVQDYWRVVTANFEEGRCSDVHKTPHVPPSNPQFAQFMLVAFALENLMKAMIIRSRQNEFRGRALRVLPSDVKTHDLKSLAKKAGIRPTLAEEDLLTRLSRVSTWAGRYPVPVEDADLKNMEAYSNGNYYLTACFLPTDVDRLNDLLVRIKGLVQFCPSWTEVSE